MLVSTASSSNCVLGGCVCVCGQETAVASRWIRKAADYEVVRLGGDMLLVHAWYVERDSIVCLL